MGLAKIVWPTLGPTAVWEATRAPSPMGTLEEDLALMQTLAAVLLLTLGMHPVLPVPLVLTHRDPLATGPALMGTAAVILLLTLETRHVSVVPLVVVALDLSVAVLAQAELAAKTPPQTLGTHLASMVLLARAAQEL